MKPHCWAIGLSVILASAVASAAQPSWAGGQGRGRGQGLQRHDRLRQCWAATQPAGTEISQPGDVNARGWRGAACPRGWGRGRCAGQAAPGRGFRAGTATRPAGFRGARGPAQIQPAASQRVSDAEHELIQKLVANHTDIKRTVRDIPGGVETVTTTSRPELLQALREHVSQMVERLEQKRPLRMWDPIFRDVFAHASEIAVKVADIEGGVVVTETTQNPDVIPMIRAHARAVSRFVEQGPLAVRPPWAGRGRW